VVDRRPALIARPTDAADVAAAVRFAREQDLVLAIRSGGHSIDGFSTCDGGMVLDLSRMRGATVDPEKRTARTNGGAFLMDLDRAAQEHGLVCPVGTVGHTGVGGLTLGGGVGRLQRPFGLTVDNLTAVELVTADGRHVRASVDEEPELFWGMRGAGPNFGVVTAFEFRLHEFGPDLVRGLRIYRPEDALTVWEAFRAVLGVAPRELSFSFVIGRAGPDADYPPEIAGGPIAVVAFTFNGSESAARKAVQSLDRAEVVDGEPERALQPSDAAPERQPTDAGVPHGSHGAHEAVLLGRSIQVHQERPAVRASRSRRWIHGRTAHPRQVDDQAVVAGREAVDAVAAAANGDHEVRVPAEPHRCSYVLGVDGSHDQRRPAIDEGAPEPARVVVPGVGRGDDLAPERGAEPIHRRSGDGHGEPR
jgi:hypothetical protein